MTRRNLLGVLLAAVAVPLAKLLPAKTEKPEPLKAKADPYLADNNQWFLDEAAAGELIPQRPNLGITPKRGYVKIEAHTGPYPFSAVLSCMPGEHVMTINEFCAVCECSRELLEDTELYGQGNTETNHEYADLLSIPARKQFAAAVIAGGDRHLLREMLMNPA